MKKKKRGFKAGTAKAKLAGQLAKYARAHTEGNDAGKKEARDNIAKMIGIR